MKTGSDIISAHTARHWHILLAWGVFLVSLVTYLLTLEPTVSYWDCPEYVAAAYGMMPGHPPGNPVWMLVARFFINFAPSTDYIPLMVNAMSALCSALTVLLTFLATSMLAKQLTWSGPHGIRAGWRQAPPRLHRTLMQEGAGVVAALMLCWSDTFWFSAVEAEVYAFSSLTTALLFWLTLSWSRHFREPHADRYLIAVAYILGLSIGVHELNLLCLPALLLIVAFTLRGYLSRRRIALIMLAAIVAIALVLYGLIPGAISQAERMELLCVNQLGLPYNSGLLIWWVLSMSLLICAIASLNAYGSRRRALWSTTLCALTALAFGLFFFSGNWVIGLLLTLIMMTPVYLQAWHGRLNVRRLRIAMWSLGMVVLGFSSYGAIIIRSAGRPPLNTGEPSDIFAFHRYFSREQYGKSPLLYGAAFTAQPQRQRTWKMGADGKMKPQFNTYRTIKPRPHMVRAVEGMEALPRGSFATRRDSLANARVLAQGRGYVLTRYDFDMAYPPEQSMWFPRLHSHSQADISGYGGWSGADTADMLTLSHVTLAVDSAGNPVEWPGESGKKHQRPTYGQNARYFFTFQLGYMYWRYFLWNFVGRQNDFTGHGEPDCGNFITGIPAIDDAMLDNVSGAPAEIASGNPGRNVYWCLPLILGILGIIAQCRSGVTGRRQALVVLVLFIVTGMAIVFYLNQGPTQARDRDYSFAGSFYAWCIWGGLGIISIYRWLKALMRNKLTAACASVTLAMIVPLQMLSQTADDHDRSGRTVARDMVQNQLKSLKPRALIFSAEDNYLFPMLYMQQVEHARPDVRMLTMPYMVTDWYASQLSLPLRDGSHLPLTGTPGHFTSWKLSYVVLGTDTTWTEALPALKSLYANCDAHRKGGYLTLPTPRVYIDMGGDTIRIDLRKRESGLSNFLRNDALIQLDLLATNAASANPRPIYVVSSLAGSLLGGQLRPYLSQVGTVSELNPKAPRFDAETIARYALYHWNYGGAGRTPAPYFDPVAAHNLSVQRRVIIRAAMQLAREKDKAVYALKLLELVEREMPEKTAWYEAERLGGRLTTEGYMLAEAWQNLAETLGRADYAEKARQIHARESSRITAYWKWKQSLRPSYRRYVSFRVGNLLSAFDSAPAPLSSAEREAADSASAR